MMTIIGDVMGFLIAVLMGSALAYGVYRGITLWIHRDVVRWEPWVDENYGSLIPRISGVLPGERGYEQAVLDKRNAWRIAERMTYAEARRLRGGG